MTGTHHVEVKNRDAVFKFDLHRNITIVRGDSGTGKTTLYDMIADGAAFGSEIDRILKMRSATNIRLCLPESFEWLILRSGLIKSENMTEILDNPSSYIECSEYFSWENFFEHYLIEVTVDTPFQYAKKDINPVYLNDNNAVKIIVEIYTE